MTPKHKLGIYPIDISGTTYFFEGYKDKRGRIFVKEDHCTHVQEIIRRREQ